MLALRYRRGLDALMSNRLARFFASHVGGLPATFWWLWSGALLSALATFVFPFLALFLTARGLSSLGRCESHTLATMDAVLRALGSSATVPNNG